MNNESKKYFLNGDSIEALKQSEGAKMLIQKPETIASLEKIVEWFKNDKQKISQNIIDTEAELALLSQASKLKRVLSFGKINSQIKQLGLQLQDLNRKADSNDVSISIYLEEIAMHKKDIDKFVDTLKGVGIKPQEVSTNIIEFWKN